MTIQTQLDWAGALLIYVPILLFVVGFLYETWLSFVRLKNPKSGRGGYVSATWEATHTLLVFAVVMILMLYTQALDQLAALIFWPTFLAAIALGVRAACYIYIFYVRSQKARINWIDWLFALTHVIATVFLVVVVLQVTWFILTQNAPVNSEFIPVFIPGLLLIAAVIALPVASIYRQK